MPDAGRGMDTGGLDRFLETCRELVDCLSSCRDDDGCASACYRDADPEAYTRYQSMLSCWGRHCSAVVGDNEAFDTCVDARCRTQTDRCLEAA